MTRKADPGEENQNGQDLKDPRPEVPSIGVRAALSEKSGTQEDDCRSLPSPCRGDEYADSDS